MKNAMIAVLISGLTLVSGVSAMEMMDSGSMMKDDKMMMSGSIDKMDKTMMKDTMMKDGKMMNMNKMSLQSIVKHCGYNWAKDRKMLAEKAGIMNYSGTTKQNLAIRAYLMGMMKNGTMMKDAITK